MAKFFLFILQTLELLRLLQYSMKTLICNGETNMKKLLLFLCALSVFSLFAQPVTPRKRYRADFEVRTIKAAYPLDWFCQGVKFEKEKYPGISFRFYNAKKKEVKYGPKSPYYVAFSEKFVPGSFEFYAPDGAAEIGLLKSGVIVRNLKLTEIPVGNNLALPVDYHITGPVRNAMISINPDGTVVFDVSASGVVETLSVPVKGGKRYRLTIRGARGYHQGKLSSLLVRYYFRKTAGGEAVSKNKESLRVGNPAKPLSYEILAPKDAKWFSIWCMWGKLLDYKLEEL